MINRRGFFSLSLKAAAATLVCAAAVQAAAEQAAAPNHPRREARRSSPTAAQEAPAERADAATKARTGSSSPVSVADNKAVGFQRRSRNTHAAARGQGGVAIPR